MPVITPSHDDQNTEATPRSREVQDQKNLPSCPTVNDQQRSSITAIREVIEPQLPLLKALATEIFGQLVDVQQHEDPEIPDLSYLEFTVLYTGPRAEISRLRTEWYRRTQEMLNEDCHYVSLFLTVE